MWSRMVMSQVKHNSWFIAGVVLGLWLALAVIPLEEGSAPCASGAAPAPDADEFEPRREEKALGAGGHAPARSLQRPRYYSTELGMRGSLLTGVLTSEDALKQQVPALNRTLARLQPALKFFITASAMSSVPGLANVVGFTDTREMLKPFHALKYLADNYLDEYDFFFLVTDGAFVNARRLAALVSRLSVSQDLYMGAPASDDSQYCSLDGGIILSNSVLRAVHGELEWCVRNSYSPHHHENLGRCVLHAAHTACTARAQGEQYEALQVPAGALGAALADGVTARPAHDPAALHTLHAYVARVFLERDLAETARLRRHTWREAARHPPGYRNGTWPGGLRADPGLAPPAPDNRFSHLRWTAFNATHAFMPDEVRAVAPLAAGARAALALVTEEARAWALRRWGGAGAAAVQLVEGAWLWDPPVALRYRLLLRLAPDRGAAATLRQVEAARPLGGARLAPVRYVTESARVCVLLAVPRARAPLAAAAAALRAYNASSRARRDNTRLLLVVVSTSDNGTSDAALLAEAAALGGGVQVLAAQVAQDARRTPAAVLQAAAARAALQAAGPHLAPADLVLLAPPHLDFNQDFLNRVRMNCLAGEQWFLPLPFARHSQYAHPRFVSAAGGKPAQHTGRFRAAPAELMAFYKADFDAALAAWRGPADASVGAILAASPLRCIRAPEPGCVLAPRPAPCDLPAAPAEEAQAEAQEAQHACLRALQAQGLGALDLGARTALAQLLLETQAEAE